MPPPGAQHSSQCVAVALAGEAGAMTSVASPWTEVDTNAARTSDVKEEETAMAHAAELRAAPGDVQRRQGKWDALLVPCHGA